MRRPESAVSGSNSVPDFTQPARTTLRVGRAIATTSQQLGAHISGKIPHMQGTFARRSWPALAVLIGIALSQGCGSDTPADTANTSDSGTSDNFVIGPNGTTHTLILPNGQELRFEFPASAAGQSITLRLVDDASYGLDGQHPNLVEMLPHGLQFDPPVLVTPDWSGDVPVLRTFADAASTPEILGIATDKRAFELPHFSLLSVSSIKFNCPFPGTDVFGFSKLCKATQHEQVFYCDNTTKCLAIHAHCCVDIAQNPNLACTELLDYGPVPINAPPCGPGDAGPDVVDAGPDSDNDAGAAGSGGSGGGTGTGGSGGSGGGTVGGCPNTGHYSVAASGACGDLNPSAPNQRLDGTGCSLYWEFDGGPSSNGIGSGSLGYNSTGVTPALPIQLGSSTYTCTVTSAHPSATLDCLGTAGTCNVSLLWTSPL